MTNTFMDPSISFIDTKAVAHYIDTGSSRPIWIPPRVGPGRKQIIEEEVTKILQVGVIHAYSWLYQKGLTAGHNKSDS